MLDIYALRVFLEAAKTENFTKAGHTLSLSQPAVSMQIRSLESYLDVELFARDGRNIRLTKSGQALVPMAEQLLQMTLNVEESIRSADGKVVGNLVIGCCAASGKYILPQLVARFQRLYPGVYVSIPVVSREEVMERVVAGEFDLGVTSKRLPDYDLDYEDFFTDHLSLIAPASHTWARSERVTAQDLLTERFICREATSACRAVVAEGLARLGVSIEQLQMVMEIGTPEALAMAVELGIGVSFVSMLAAMPRLALGRLVTVDVEGLELRIPVEFVQNSRRPASRVQMKFLEFANHPQNRPLVDMLAQGRMV
jgi:DNA-binding transcriptional LysR family regulator